MEKTVEEKIEELFFGDKVETMCDSCGKYTTCYESEITGLVFCAACFNEAEAGAIYDKEIDGL